MRRIRLHLRRKLCSSLTAFQTYTGTILVAVNPYKEVELYSPVSRIFALFFVHGTVLPHCTVWLPRFAQHEFLGQQDSTVDGATAANYICCNNKPLYCDSYLLQLKFFFSSHFFLKNVNF